MVDLHELKLFGEFRECSEEDEKRIYKDGRRYDEHNRTEQ